MPTHPNLRERNKTERRRLIFHRAMQLFEAKGFQGTTYTDIAEAAGVSRGTVFNYFPYKESILLELFAQALEEMRTRLEERRAAAREAIADEPIVVAEGGARSSDGAAGRQGSRPAGYSELHFLFDQLADFVERRRELVLPLSYELLNPDPERSRAAYLAIPLGPILRDVVGRARADGAVRTDYSRDRLARIVANTYFITALQWAAYRHDRSVHDELRLALDLTMEGLAAS